MAAPEDILRRLHDGAAGAFGLVKHGGDVLAYTDIVGQGDRTRRAAATVLQPDIFDEPGTGIEGKTDSVEREADDGIGLLFARNPPAERLVKRACA